MRQKNAKKKKPNFDFKDEEVSCGKEKNQGKNSLAEKKQQHKDGLKIQKKCDVELFERTIPRF